MASTRAVVGSIEQEYQRYRKLAEGAMRQLSEEELCRSGGETASSIATIVWHISGNLESRFTDFLTTDGEKPWRKREEEFEGRAVSREELLAKWARGFAALDDALAPLCDADLASTVTIRAIPHTIGEALHRSLAHTAYHVGQIVYVAKALRASAWEYLSIPPGKSDEVNRRLMGGAAGREEVAGASA